VRRRRRIIQDLGAIAAGVAAPMTLTALFRSAETDRRHRPDLRLVPIMLAAYAAAFLGDGVGTVAGLLFWAACAVAGFAFLARTKRRTAAAMLLVGAGVGVAATTRIMVLRDGPIPDLAAAHSTATVEAVVTDDPRTITTKHGPLVIVPARAELVSTADAAYRVRVPVTVMTSSTELWRSLLPSTRLRITGRLAPPGDGWPDAALLSTRRAPDVIGGPSLLQRFAGRLRQDLRDACKGLPADPRGLVPGLVIGDTSEEPASLAEAFRDTGLTHLTAVSGENLVFLLGAVMPLARIAGVRGRMLTLFGLAVVIGFTVLARPEPSMVRASVMSLLGLAVAATGRQARGVPLLCAGAVLLLLADPWLARSYGFALSFSATAGLFILAPGWQERLRYRRVPARIAESLACTAAAETFCLPILVSLTAAITPLSLPANLLAEFCVGPATVLGAAALVAAAVWLPLGQAVAWLAQWPTDGIVGVARYGSRLPGAVVHWPSGAAGTCALLAAYAVVIMATAAVSARRTTRRGAR
jgi:competence protein ComEC